VEVVFDVAERSVAQTGTGRFPFRVVGADGPVTLRVQPIDPQRHVVARLRAAVGDDEPRRHELVVGPRRRRRMPAGTHVFRLTAHARDRASIAAADAVLQVVPCVRVEEPAFVREPRSGVALMRVALSSRCGCVVRCVVRAWYGDRTIDGAPRLTVGLETVHADLPLPCDTRGGRLFDPAEAYVEVACDDGTVIRRRPGEPSSVSSPGSSGVRAARRGRSARIGAAAGLPGPGRAGHPG
jgi:hypothetical protein